MTGSMITTIVPVGFEFDAFMGTINPTDVSSPQERASTQQELSWKNPNFIWPSVYIYIYMPFTLSVRVGVLWSFLTSNRPRNNGKNHWRQWNHMGKTMEKPMEKQWKNPSKNPWKNPWKYLVDSCDHTCFFLNSISSSVISWGGWWDDGHPLRRRGLFRK